MSEPQTLDLEELQAYLVIGIRKDGSSVTASSQGLTLPDMGMLLGRANTDLALHVAGAGAFDAMTKMQQAQGKIAMPTGAQTGRYTK